MRGMPLLATILGVLALLAILAGSCQDQMHSHDIERPYVPTMAATPLPGMEPTPEPTEVPKYWVVTLYATASQSGQVIKSWKVPQTTTIDIKGSGFEFIDDNGKGVMICGTITIEEE